MNLASLGRKLVACPRRLPASPLPDPGERLLRMAEGWKDEDALRHRADGRPALRVRRTTEIEAQQVPAVATHRAAEADQGETIRRAASIA